MQSLTSFLDPLSSAAPVKGAKAMTDAKGAENSGKPDFSGLLKAVAKPSKSPTVEIETLAAAKLAETAAAVEAPQQDGKDGTGLPLMVNTGKSLPDALPVSATGTETGTDEEDASTQLLTGDAAMALVAALLGNTPRGEANGDASGKTDSAPRHPAPAKLPTQAENTLGGTDTRPLLAAQQPVSDEAKAAQRNPAVALRVAERSGDDKSTGQTNSPTQKFAVDQASPQQAAPRGDTGKNDGAQGDSPRGNPQPLRIAGTDMPRDMQQAGAAFSADPAQSAPAAHTQPAIHAAPHTAPNAANAAANVDARQDLAQIVDRLIAAREAAAPASADLSINHREFGELSLRIDQRHDGRLAVELSARDPDAHRAVAAAMAADRGQFSGNDQSSSGSNAQQQSQQARLGTAGREAAAGNGSNSGQSSARQDQPQGRPAMQRGGQSNNSDRQPRGGIFA